jgi:site-specific recombinase XerD
LDEALPSTRGYLTSTQAEGRLAAILAGKDPTVIVTASGVTFRLAAEEWLRYVAHDRKRERSTVLRYRQAVEHRLLPAFGLLPLDAIDVKPAERWRVALLADGLSASSVNKLRWKAEAIYKRAMRVWDVSTNPFALLERQPQRSPGDFNILAADEILLLASRAANEQDAALFTWRLYGPAAGRAASAAVGLPGVLVTPGAESARSSC